jgi:dTDP-4-dehydrorhamnose 3,5-epimerase
MQILRVPGKYWHGFKVVGNESAYLIYFVNKLYDYA